jgi:60 kDa SS-A/Ro ribonucleoprotein
LRDVLFLCHARPKDAEQAAVWKKLVENTLEPLVTGEVVLSAGKDKRENFNRLLPHHRATGTTGAVGRLAAPFFGIRLSRRL